MNKGKMNEGSNKLNNKCFYTSWCLVICFFKFKISSLMDYYLEVVGRNECPSDPESYNGMVRQVKEKGPDK
jgi:hypothetical protein